MNSLDAMHAITVPQPGGPENIRWTEVPTPEPGPGEVLVRTIAAGVNRADLLQRQGHYPPPAGVTEVMGLEASGIVEAVGQGVTAWHPGDAVVALLAGGGYAEFFVAPAGQVVRPPTGVDLVTASALMEVAATVHSNMRHVHLIAGETLLVHGGAGGIGQFAIQYARGLGCRVGTTAGTPDKLEICRSLGAEIVLDYHDDWVAGLREATAGHGADVILDLMGAKYLDANLAALAMDGRLCIIGMQGGVTGSLNIATLMAKRATVTATGLRARPLAQKAEICADVAASVWPLYERGLIQPPPLTRIPMPDAAAAHALLGSGTSSGKIALIAPSH